MCIRDRVCGERGEGAYSLKNCARVGTERQRDAIRCQRSEAGAVHVEREHLPGNINDFAVQFIRGLSRDRHGSEIERGRYSVGCGSTRSV